MRSFENTQELERAITPGKPGETYDSPNRVQKNFKMTTKKTNFGSMQVAKNALKYGLFESKLIDDVNNMQDWRVKK